MKIILSVFCFFILSVLTNNHLIAQMFWNHSCSFAGNSTSYISVPNSSSLNITGSFTFEAWVNPATLSGASKGLISKGGALGTSLRYAVRLNTNGTVAFIKSGTPTVTSRLSNS